MLATLDAHVDFFLLLNLYNIGEYDFTVKSVLLLCLLRLDGLYAHGPKLYKLPNITSRKCPLVIIINVKQFDKINNLSNDLNI